MTVTPSGRPARRRASRAAAAVVAILALSVPLVVPTAALADTATPAPTPTPTPPIEPGTTAFTLSPISNGLVHPGEALNVSMTIQNETDAATPTVTADLSLGRTALDDRAALTAWLDGDTSGVRTEDLSLIHI